MIDSTARAEESPHASTLLAPLPERTEEHPRDADTTRGQNYYRFVPLAQRDHEGVVASGNQYRSGTGRHRGVGVLSDSFSPYRPLGTPNLSAKRKSISDDGANSSMDFSETPKFPGKGFYQPRVAMASSVQLADDAEKAASQAPAKAECRPKLGANGFDKLWSAVKMSDARKNSVRSGHSIGSTLHDGPAALRNRRTKKSHHNKTSSTLKLPVIRGAAPKSPEEQKNESPQDDAVIDKFFNLASSVSILKSDFETVRGHAKRRVEAALKVQEEGRDKAFKYKMQSLARLDKDTQNPAAFSHEKWRLQADRNRIEAQLNAINNHQWFLSLMELVTEHGRRMTQPEEHVVGEIKKVVENGEAFDLFDFLTMAACVPPTYHDNAFIRQIFNHVRESVGLPLQSYIDFLDQQGIEVHQELLTQIRLEKEAVEHVGEMRRRRNTKFTSRSRAITGMLVPRKAGSTASMRQRSSGTISVSSDAPEDM